MEVSAIVEAFSVEAASAAEARMEASFDCWRRGREVKASRDVPEPSSSSLSRLGFRRSGDVLVDVIGVANGRAHY